MSVITELSLNELAVLEAARRALEKSRQARRFDPTVFKAVAEMELAELQTALAKRP